MRQFKYMYEVTATGFLDIEDPCNTCIYTTNNLFQEYVLIIQTEMGRTKVFEYGPNLIDLDKLAPKVSFTYQEFDVNTNKVETLIDKFLAKTFATQAIEIDINDAIDKIKDMRCFIDVTEREG